jgi:hypothetical protein
MSDIYSDRRPRTPDETSARRLSLIVGSGDAPAVRRTSTAALLQTIERLEQVIELETSALKLGQQAANLSEFNARKSQGLLELNRMLKGMDPAVLEKEVGAPLARLRTKLDRNLHILQNHLRAVREVARVIAGAIQDAESDGTYSAYPGSWQTG